MNYLLTQKQDLKIKDQKIEILDKLCTKLNKELEEHKVTQSDINLQTWKQVVSLDRKVEENDKFVENLKFMDKLDKLYEEKANLTKALEDLVQEKISISKELHDYKISMELRKTHEDSTQEKFPTPVSKELHYHKTWMEPPNIQYEKTKVHDKPQNKTKSDQHVQSEENPDCVLYMNSHGNKLDPKKLYKHKNVKIHVLPFGKKNIDGVREKIENSQDNEIGKINVIGVADNKIKWKPEEAAEEMCKLLNELNKKFPNKKFSVLAPIERIDDEEYNQGIQIFINEVIVKCGISSVISHSINARKNFLYYDNTHLNDTGIKMLARSLKIFLNPLLGLIPYSDYKKVNLKETEFNQQSDR